jgi:hypothetical protein
VEEFAGKFAVDGLRSSHYKRNTVTGGQIKYLGDIKLLFNVPKFLGQIFLTDNQLTQLLQFNLFVRKCYDLKILQSYSKFNPTKLHSLLSPTVNALSNEKI